MIGHDDFDRTLAGWFDAEARSSLPGGGLDRVRVSTRRRRPLPAWLAGPGSRWVGELPVSGSSSGIRSIPRALGLRWATALVLLLILAALLGGAILVGARVLQPPPVSTDRIGHLAYGLDGEMYVADWDGSNKVRIARRDSITGPGSCGASIGEGTIWSPDGRYLAYRSAGNDVCRESVVIADEEGRTVASFPGGGWLVSWSPDSTRVATWVDGDGMVGIYGLDGVRQAVLTVQIATAPGDYDPVWSPEGQSLIVPHGIEVPVDGRPTQRLPDSDPRSGRNWAYSPRGTAAAYLEIGAGTASLVVTSGDGSRRVLVDGGIPYGGLGLGPGPVWSATGDRIAFVAQAAGGTELRVVEVATGTVTSLVDADGSQVHPIAFSPDGDLILYAKWDVNDTTGAFSNRALWAVRIDGSEARVLVTGTDWGEWQPLPSSPR